MQTIRGHFDGRLIVPDEPVDLPAGQVLLIVPIGNPPDFAAHEDEAAAAWSDGIAREWSLELNDPREDIYSLSDGEPVDDAG